jgi:predicted MFS family arabinose efflux permease
MVTPSTGLTSYRAQLGITLLLMIFIGTAASGILPILPIVTRRVTRNTGEVGTVTAAMALATVVLELQTRRLLERFNTGYAIRAGFALCALALALFAVVASLPIMIALGALFGVGFGVVVVTTSATVANLAPAAAMGRAIGAYGIAAALPQIIAPGAALNLLAKRGPTAVFLTLAGSCAVGTLLATTLRLPSLRGQGARLRIALERPRLLTAFSAYYLAAFAFGGIISYAAFVVRGNGLRSASFFFVAFGITRVASRAVSGLALDYVDESQVSLICIIVATFGLFLLAGAPTWSFAAALICGAGLGGFQTTSFVSMLNRVPRPDSAVAISLWNFAADGGIGTSALTLGQVASAWGYRAVFTVLPFALIAALALRTVDRLQRFRA